MKLVALKVKGAFLIMLDPKEDHRGSFSRLFCEQKFARLGLESHFVQCNHSYSRKAGTLRGLHFQEAPAEEVKVIKCVRGEIFDVIVDVKTKEFEAITLKEGDHKLIYIPKGAAHGFQTLQDDSELIYFVSAQYSPEQERGIRYDALPIPWPLPNPIISDKDAHYGG